MTFAAIGDTPYNIVLLIHIASALVAFAPALVHPLVLNGVVSSNGDVQTAAATMQRNSQRIYAPALIVTGLLGFALAGMSDQVFSMSQGWLIGAFVVWVAMNGLLHALVIPGERALAAGDLSVRDRVNQASAGISLLIVIMLWLMIFKPGL